MAKKPSFFDRLTGANFDNDFDTFEEKTPAQSSSYDEDSTLANVPEREEPGAAQLTVDVYQNDSDIMIRALVAGVRPEDLDIAITRDMVTIQGKRVDQKEVSEDGYVYRELYWGAFARTIVLPAEIDVDSAEASEKHGLLTLKLPKINKNRQTKLKVKG